MNLAYRRSYVPHPLDCFGFVVPAVEDRKIIACTFSSVKFPNRAPEGLVLLRVFLGWHASAGTAQVRRRKPVEDRTRGITGT